MFRNFLGTLKIRLLVSVIAFAPLTQAKADVDYRTVQQVVIPANALACFVLTDGFFKSVEITCAAAHGVLLEKILVRDPGPFVSLTTLALMTGYGFETEHHLKEGVMYKRRKQ